MSSWTLTGATTEYTVTTADEWLELHSWGPLGVRHGPSPLAFHGKVQYLTRGDVAPVEYATDGQRPFLGADLVAGGLRWQLDSVDETDGLRATFVDPLTGLRAVQCYRFAPGTDVIERWVTLHNDGSSPIPIAALGSAAFTVPTPDGARLGYLSGQWAQEFTWAEIDLPRGRFEIGSAQGVTGHQFAPYLCVNDRWGVQLAWSGSWQIVTEVDAVGTTRVRVGSVGGTSLAPGESITTPIAAGAYSGEGVDGLARVWHAYERTLARDRPRDVIYNSWEATTFDVTAAGQLALADIAADLGVETFVVDDGWFIGRNDRIGSPDDTRCAVQYTLGRRTVVLAWNTGTLDGLGHVPGREVRLPLHGLVPTTRYRADDMEFSGAHLTEVGLPVRWTATHDAGMIVLEEL